MANLKKGFSPSRKNDGGANTTGQLWHPIANGYASNLFTGDPVQVSLGYLCLAEKGKKVVGVFNGCRYIDADGRMQEKPYFPSSTSSSGLLNDVHATPLGSYIPARGNYFVIPAETSVSAAAIGDVYTVNLSAGSTLTGRSGVDVDVSAITETSTDGVYGMVRVVALHQLPGAALTDAAALIEVEFNNIGMIGA